MTWDPRKLDLEWPFDVMSTDFALHAESTTLIVVDMQRDTMIIEPNSPLALGHPPVVAYWTHRVNEIVVPNIHRLIGLFRDQNLKIVYTRNGRMTPTGDEMTERLKAKLGRGTLQSHRDSPGYQIDEGLSPRSTDLIVDKLTSGAFTASLLDHALRNMGVRSVVITGLLLVADCGACGLFATHSAAREGVRVFVLDRLYALGGNVGPGTLVGAFVGPDRNTGWVWGLDKDRTCGGLA